MGRQVAKLPRSAFSGRCEGWGSLENEIARLVNLKGPVEACAIFVPDAFNFFGFGGVPRLDRLDFPFERDKRIWNSGTVSVGPHLDRPNASQSQQCPTQ